jgi:hypothetical protein
MRRGVAGMLGIAASTGLLATPCGEAIGLTAPPPATADGCLRGTGLHQAAARERGEQSPPVNDLGWIIPAGNITVPVRFHVIASGRTGLLSEADVVRQINVMNRAYAGGSGSPDTGVTFRLDSVDFTDRPEWFRAPHTYETSIKTLLHRGGPETLNLYTASVGDEVLGFSTFPQWQSRGPIADGVVIDYRSLPGGNYQHFNLGYTAVHETGHWLGLFHTFENGCDQPGDGVADTPYEGYPTDGCPGLKNTCTAVGNDPVHNFMDYAWDDCMHEFTPGQVARIHQSWAAYREIRQSSA